MAAEIISCKCCKLKILHRIHYVLNVSQKKKSNVVRTSSRITRMKICKTPFVTISCTIPVQGDFVGRKNLIQGIRLVINTTAPPPTKNYFT
jgi:hypothetical protein